MIVIDSSGWLEFFADAPLADEYAARLARPQHLITPTLVVYEVYKWIKRERTEEDALTAVAAIQKTRVVPLTEEIALMASDLSLAHRLVMADSIMLATARSHDAELVTSDSDFAGIDGVTVLSASRRS